MIPDDLRRLREELQEAGRYMVEHGLAWGNAGNISARIDGDNCLITAGGSHLGGLADEELVSCGLKLAGREKYPRKPSKELPMHAAVYQARPEVNAVLHGAPFHSTLVACAGVELPTNWFVEDMYYLERVERVAYHHPGSNALADAVREKAGRADILLLENHGVLVYDTGLREALMGLHTLEVVCRMLLAAKGAGVNMKPLPADVVKDFLERSGYRPRRAR